MRLADNRLLLDTQRAASAAFFVAAIELDEGTLFLSDRIGDLGSDAITCAIGNLAANAQGFNIETSALPEQFANARWINRQIAILECVPGMGSVYDGSIVFDGIVAAEPSLENGLLAVSLSMPSRQLVIVPDYGIIEAGAWPLASAAAMGALKPQIFGTVELCPLLPVQVQPFTALAEPAASDDKQLLVKDATGLAASGSVVVGGHTYTYTSRTSNSLLGMSISASHRTGTLAAQAGSNVYLAAGHAVSALNTIRCGDALIEGGVVDLAAATVTYASPPSVAVSASRFTLDMQLDAVATPAAPYAQATNPDNAIRAVTGTYNQNAALPAGIDASAPGYIVFSRPPAGRVISGTYLVTFGVSVPPAQVGWLRATIAGQIVWAYEPGVGVAYNASPATLQFDDDVDQIEVRIETAQGFTSAAALGITAASRVVLTGNIDDANFATVAPSQALRVVQTTSNPDRGPIDSARLVVRWFASDAALGTATVKFDGKTLGALKLTPNSGTSVSKTIAVDSVTQGHAALPQQAISTVVGGGTASLSHSSIPQSVPVPVSLINYGAYIRGYSKIPEMRGYTAGSAVAVKIQYVVPNGSSFDITLGPWANVRRADGTNILQVSSSNCGTPVLVASNTYEVTVTIYEQPYSVYWDGLVNTTVATAMFISWNGAFTSGAITQSNTPASGSSAPIPAQSLGNSGISVALANNVITVNVPAPPRVQDTVFPLPYTGWADFTNTDVLITLDGGTASVMVMQALIQVEYDEITYAAAGVDGTPLTATVTGSSGNPADIIKALAEAAGETINSREYLALRNWFISHSYTFARRVADVTDALTLRTMAQEQAGVLAVPVQDRLRLVRWFDLSASPDIIGESGLLQPARIGWADRVENNVTLRYKQDYAANAGMTRVLQATPANNLRCAFGKTALGGKVLPVEMEGGWLRSDSAAALYLDAATRRYAQPRRLISLSLPYLFADTEAGDLIEYNEVLYRITGFARPDGFCALDGEEILS